jgi:hypothetical protein
MPGILLWTPWAIRRFLCGILCCTAPLRPLLSADLGNQPPTGRSAAYRWEG